MRLEPIFAFGFATLAMAWMGRSTAGRRIPPRRTRRLARSPWNTRVPRPGLPPIRLPVCIRPATAVPSPLHRRASTPGGSRVDRRWRAVQSIRRWEDARSTRDLGDNTAPTTTGAPMASEQGSVPRGIGIGRDCVRLRIPSIRHMASPNAGSSSSSTALRRTTTHRRASPGAMPEAAAVPGVGAIGGTAETPAPPPRRSSRSGSAHRGRAERSGEKARAKVRPHSPRRRPTWVRPDGSLGPHRYGCRHRDSRARSRRVRLRSP